MKTQLDMQEEGQSFEQLRSQVENYVRAKTPWMQTARADQVRPGAVEEKKDEMMENLQAMVAALKGKGKGKHGKGKGKGKFGKGKSFGGKGKAMCSTDFQGMCHACGQWGHRASECPQAPSWMNSSGSDWMCWMCGGYGHKSHECANHNYSTYADEDMCDMLTDQGLGQQQGSTSALGPPTPDGQTSTGATAEHPLLMTMYENSEDDLLDTQSEKALYRQAAGYQ